MLEDSGHATMPKFEINTRRLINSSLSFLALAAIIALFFAYRSHAQHLIPHNVRSRSAIFHTTRFARFTGCSRRTSSR